MDIVRGKVQKERFAAMVLNKRHRLLGDPTGHVFIDPTGRFPARHVTDAADSVHDRFVVAVVELHLEQVGPFGARRLVAHFGLIIDLNRIRGIETIDAVVFDINTGRAVAGRRDDVAVFKTDFEWPGF